MIAPEAPPVEAPCPDSREIRGLEDRRYEAMLRADTAMLSALLSALLSDAMIYTHSDGTQDGKVDYIAKVGYRRYVYRSIEHDVRDVVCLGTTALVHGWMRSQVDVEGVARSLDNVSLAVWSFEGPAPQLVVYASTAIKRR
jgi:hypothetical protein